MYKRAKPLKAQIAESKYILKVKLINSAKYPTIAGPKIKPAKPKVNKFDTVRLIDSFVSLIACRKTTATKFAVPKPKIIIPKRIMYRFEVKIDKNKIVQDIILK